MEFERSTRAGTPQPLVLVLSPGGERVSGSVVDASGGVIAGALVGAVSAQGERAVALADGLGNFTLDVTAGAQDLQVTAEGYSTIQRQIQAPVEGLKLALVAEASITGRVVAEGTLAPVGDVTVSAWSPDGPSTGARAERSAEDGTFRLKGLGPGRYQLVASAENWRSDEQWISLGVAETLDQVELRVRTARRFEGLVRVAGEACKRGAVQLKGAVSAYAMVDAEGRVGIDGVPRGSYQVNVECDGALELSEQLQVGGEKAPAVWNLEAGLLVSGVALTASGGPLAAASIDVSPVGEPLDRPYVRCSSNERGEFSCGGLKAGDYECALAGDPRPRSDVVRLRAPALHVVLRARAEASIRARLEGATSLELPSLVLVARHQDGTRLLGELSGNEFVFAPAPLGSYEVSNESSPSGTGERVTLTSPGQVARVTLSIPALHAISGRVVDDTEQGIPDAWIRASGSPLFASLREATPVLTAADGTFSLSGLLPGRYRLAVSSRQGMAEVEDVASDARAVVLRVHP